MKKKKKNRPGPNPLRRWRRSTMLAANQSPLKVLGENEAWRVVQRHREPEPLDLDLMHVEKLRLIHNQTSTLLDLNLKLFSIVKHTL